MKLTGKVIKAFNDGDDSKRYAQKKEYNKKTDKGYIYTAEESRYLYLFSKGYLEEGQPIEEKPKKENNQD